MNFFFSLPSSTHTLKMIVILLEEDVLKPTLVSGLFYGLSLVQTPQQYSQGIPNKDKAKYSWPPY